MNNQFDQNNLVKESSALYNKGEERFDNDTIDIKEYLGIVIEYRWFIMLLTLAALFLGGLFAVFSTRIYSVDALLQVEDKKSAMGLDALGDMAGLMGGGGGGGSKITAEIEILRSRAIRLETIKKLYLQIEAAPNFFPVIGERIFNSFSEKDKVASPWFGASSYAWGGEKIKIEQLNVPKELDEKELTLIAAEGGKFILLDPNDNQLLEGIVGQVVDNGKGTIIYVETLISQPKTEFIVIHHSIGEALKEINKNLGALEKGKKSGILRVSFSGSDKYKITEILNTIIKEYVMQNIERGSEEAEKSLEFLMKQLPALKEQVVQSAKNYQEYKIKHGSVHLMMETKGFLENVHLLAQELVKSRQERDGYRQRFKDTHPVIIGLSAKIEEIESAQKEMTESAKLLPISQQEILKLEQDLEIKTMLYNRLQNRTQELRITKAATVGNVRAIDFAMIPEKHIKPKTKNILIFSLVLGLMLGVLSAFMMRMFRGGVSDIAEIEKKFGITVYASILRSVLFAKFKNKGLLIDIDKDDPAIESIRSLKTTLHFTLMSAKNNIILVTGVSPSIGKSFISANLGGILSEGGKTTIVVDADLRRGTIHQLFGSPRVDGLTDLIMSSISTDEAVQTSEIEGLSYMTTGTLPKNPAELLLHVSFEEKIKILSEKFDYVIIDTPPTLAASDAAVIARYAGIILFVLKSNSHPMKEIEQGVRKLTQAGIHINGFIMNDVVNTKGSTSNYVYHYDYKNND